MTIEKATERPFSQKVLDDLNYLQLLSLASWSAGGDGMTIKEKRRARRAFKKKIKQGVPGAGKALQEFLLLIGR